MEGGEAAQGVAQHKHGFDGGFSAVRVVLDVCAPGELSIEVEPKVAPYGRGKERAGEAGKPERDDGVFALESAGDKVHDFKLIVLGNEADSLEGGFGGSVLFGEKTEVDGKMGRGGFPEAVVDVELESGLGVNGCDGEKEMEDDGA